MNFIFKNFAKVSYFTKEELNKILADHQEWLTTCGREGEYANLRYANLFNADLRDANLRDANLFNADLRGANLRYANLRYADLRDADLRDADLRDAILSGADLRYANLSNADLSGADLSGADLSGADLTNTELYIPMACPEEGSFIGYKKAGLFFIVKLEILSDAKRCSATGRKCRCSKARVLSITNLDGRVSEKTEIASTHDPNFIYKLGEIVSVPDFDEDRWNECSTGIHFFINREEAVQYLV